jgi:hypothetical protein
MIDYGPTATDGIFKLGHRPLGRRCVILFLLGLAWLLTGIGLATIHTERFSRPGEGGPLDFLDTTPLVGLVWVVGGLLGIIGGLIRPWHRDDGYGFLGLSVPPFIYMLCYLWSFGAAVWSAAIGVDGYGRLGNWPGVPLFAAVTGIVLFLARWPDPTEPFTQPARRADAP